jgi:hypothetical protein
LSEEVLEVALDDSFCRNGGTPTHRSIYQATYKRV